MERITQKTESGYYVPPEQQAQALARLGRWEDMTERLEQEQADYRCTAGAAARRGQGEIRAVSRAVCAQADGLHHAGYAAAQQRRINKGGFPMEAPRMLLYVTVAFRRKVYTNVYIRIKAYLNVSKRI